MSNPQFPFPIPGVHNDTANHEGDQKEPAKGGIAQSHNGSIVPMAERRPNGKEITDLYQWEEE